MIDWEGLDCESYWGSLSTHIAVRAVGEVGLALDLVSTRIEYVGCVVR